MNPFTSVWLHPKQTARYVIEHKTVLYSLLLVVAGLIASGSSAFQKSDLYPDTPYMWIVLVTFIIAPILGLIFYAITIGFTFLIGKLLKGTGTYTNLFQASSISCIPLLILFPVYLIWIVVSPESFFLTNVNDIFTVVVAIINVIVGIWATVIFVAAVSEAFQFSILRAILTLLIPSIVIIGIFAVIALIIAAFLVSTMSM